MIIQEITKELGVERLTPKYPFITAEVVYVYRYEMAQKPEDILARRFRLSFLDSQTSQQLKERVSEIISNLQQVPIEK